MKNGVQGKWRSLVAEFGGKRIALLYVLHRLLDRISRGRAGIVPYRLVAQPIGNPALASVRSDSSTVVRRITPDDPVVASFPRPRDVIERRFADGSECYVAFVKGDFAGHIWIARGRYAEDEIRCTYRIANPTIGLWDYDVYVQPTHRLGRTLSRLWKAVDDALAAEGAAWSFSRINRFNPQSIRSHERLGALPVGDLVALRLAGAQFSLRRVAGGRWIAGWRAPELTLSAVDPQDT